MSDYYVFTQSQNIRKITASSAHVARSKYTILADLDISEDEDVIVVPATHAMIGKAKIGQELKELNNET